MRQAVKSEVADDYAHYRPPAGSTAADRRVLENLRLVLSLVLRTRAARRGGRFAPDVDDLIQAGMLGLMRAADRGTRRPGASRFDPKRGAFTTYAGYWIKRSTAKLVETGGLGYGSTRTRGEGQMLAGAVPVLANETEPRASDPFPWDLAEDVDRLDAAIARLRPREAEIIRRRWGLDGRPVENCREIGLAVGLSRERVRQIEVEARARIAALMAS